MKDDPDELLKTKGKRKRKRIDPDDCMKIKGLRDHRGEGGILLKRQEVRAPFGANEETKRIDPDECLKIKGLGHNPDEAMILLKRNGLGFRSQKNREIG
jgi:hypothetical protein